MATAALACQPQFIQSLAFRSNLGIHREIHNLRISRATRLFAILLDKLKELLPLTGDGKIARIATDWNWEIHDTLVL